MAVPFIPSFRSIEIILFLICIMTIYCFFLKFLILFFYYINSIPAKSTKSNIIDLPSGKTWEGATMKLPSWEETLTWTSLRSFLQTCSLSTDRKEAEKTLSCGCRRSLPEREKTNHKKQNTIKNLSGSKRTDITRSSLERAKVCSDNTNPTDTDFLQLLFIAVYESTDIHINASVALGKR